MLSERWAKARRTFPQLRRNELGERVCRMWGAVRTIFGSIFHDVGASGAELGAIWGSFWGGLEVIWGLMDPNCWRAASWALWRSSGGALGTIWGPSWTSPGRPLGQSWSRQGPSWCHLGAILGRLGASWGDLGPSWGSLGALGGVSGATVAPSVRIVKIIEKS